MDVNLQHIEAGIRYFLTEGNDELTPGEKFVFILTIRLIDQQHIVTKQEICKSNQAKPATTYAFLRSLEHKGYLKSNRSKQYFSRAFISITQKGLLFKSRMKRYILNSPYF
ncbi:hypothetical protein [Algoriphagus limi]|uniref:Transcription regulator PadR N-terminal domain-containing protein n=1 Tax=Algoriphagus limi TaxID=2975273 RepID=A0ABT2G0W0_9BACT|nr:hypothetical protein [Algoriphagus limi]MCS5488913.1 hypothetical protein [Algoriphagus limi]